METGNPSSVSAAGQTTVCWTTARTWKRKTRKPHIVASSPLTNLDVAAATISTNMWQYDPWVELGPFWDTYQVRAYILGWDWWPTAGNSRTWTRFGWVGYAQDVRRFWYEFPIGQYSTILRRKTYQVADNVWMVYQIRKYSSAPYVQFFANDQKIGDSEGYVVASRPIDTVEMLGDMNTYANQMPGAQL